jgi:hypothetical protein
VEQRNRDILHGLELDIYIPSKYIAIEVNGNFWHSEVGGHKYKNYHINKTVQCNNNGIRLIHIFEDEWIENEAIVKSRLKHILNVNDHYKSIFARKCEIKQISSSDSKLFLTDHHIQGCVNASINLGAYYNNELISVMTFGKFRSALGSKNQNSNEYEMYRFCSKSDIKVVGIAGRLLSYFIRLHNPQKIISYSDRRWGAPVGSLYEKIGFNRISIGIPNYWYVNKDYLRRVHRFNFRKSELPSKLKTFNPQLTEWENMQLNGYDRIWDCGNFKYEWHK